MATGTSLNITGIQSYDSVLEFSAYDDILTVIGATLELLLPAGDIEMMQGADTLTVTNSTINGATGVAIKLGSGNDVVTLQNSTIKSRISLASGDDIVYVNGGAQSTVTVNALAPDQTSIDTAEDLTTLSLGSGNDTLVLNAILVGTGVIRFGDGVDTLEFNAGTLNNTGGMDKLENLTVTNLGGTTYRNIGLTGDGNRILWNGNLVGSDNRKWITIEAGSTDLSAVDFITASNVVSNVGFAITNRTFTQSNGGTWEISNRADDAAITADNSVVKLYNMVLTNNNSGITSKNTHWTIHKSDISRHTAGGANLTGGSLTLDKLNFTDNRNYNIASYYDKSYFIYRQIVTASANGDIYAQGGAILQSGGGMTLSNTDFSGNYTSASAAATAAATAYAYPYGSAFASAAATAYVQGGAIWQSGGGMTLTDCTFSGNYVTADAAATATASGTATATSPTRTTAYACSYATAYAWAMGGAIWQSGGDMTLTDCTFSGNYVTANAKATGTATATAYAYGTAAAAAYYDVTANAYASAQGGAIWQNGGNMNMTLTGVTFRDNSAAATTAQGGAIWRSGGEMTLTDVTFSGNIASAYPPANYHAAAQGGAIWQNGGNMTLIGVTFSGNIASVFRPANYHAAAQGGAIWQNGGNMTLIGVTFSGNCASVSPPVAGYHATVTVQGGAIYQHGGAMTLTDVTFGGNSASACATATAFGTATATATAQGGAIWRNGDAMTLTGVIFDGNIASATAYAYPTRSATATATACAQGGAIWQSGGILNLTDTVFTGNRAAAAATASGTATACAQGGALYAGGGRNSPTR